MDHTHVEIDCWLDADVVVQIEAIAHLGGQVEVAGNRGITSRIKSPVLETAAEEEAGTIVQAAKLIVSASVSITFAAE